ncbi:MAG: RsmE family RNA methyltransferase [Myxococcota bacterium]
MNLLLLLPDDPAQGELVRVEGPRARHAIEILGAQPGARLRAGWLGGPLVEAVVEAVEAEAILLSAPRTGAPDPRPRTDLWLAIPRPKTLIKVLPEMAAFGVDELRLIRTWKVEKPYLTADILSPSNYRPHLWAGLMQARRTEEPRVMIEPLFRPFIEDRGAEATFGRTHRFVLDPGAAVSLGSLAVPAEARVVAAIGPEGGFIPYEIQALVALGFTPVRIAERPLRVETAVVAFLAQLELLRGQAGGS